MDRKPKNCNHCIYKREISRYLDREDYCSNNGKEISSIHMQTECPLKRSRITAEEFTIIGKLSGENL